MGFGASGLGLSVARRRNPSGRRFSPRSTQTIRERFWDPKLKGVELGRRRREGRRGARRSPAPPGRHATRSTTGSSRRSPIRTPSACRRAGSPSTAGGPRACASARTATAMWSRAWCPAARRERRGFASVTGSVRVDGTALRKRRVSTSATSFSSSRVSPALPSRWPAEIERDRDTSGRAGADPRPGDRPCDDLVWKSARVHSTERQGLRVRAPLGHVRRCRARDRRHALGSEGTPKARGPISAGSRRSTGSCSTCAGTAVATIPTSSRRFCADSGTPPTTT